MYIDFSLISIVPSIYALANDLQTEVDAREALAARVVTVEGIANRVVTTHSSESETTGDDQIIYGTKSFNNYIRGCGLKSIDATTGIMCASSYYDIGMEVTQIKGSETQAKTYLHGEVWGRSGDYLIESCKLNMECDNSINKGKIELKVKEGSNKYYGFELDYINSKYAATLEANQLNFKGTAYLFNDVTFYGTIKGNTQIEGLVGLAPTKIEDDPNIPGVGNIKVPVGGTVLIYAESRYYGYTTGQTITSSSGSALHPAKLSVDGVSKEANYKIQYGDYVILSCVEPNKGGAVLAIRVA